MILRVEDLVVAYGKKRIVHDVNFTLERGEILVIAGESGSGKSTIMNIIGCLDVPSEGEYYLDSVVVLPRFRGLGIGKALVNAFVERAFAEGAERVGLIVDKENPYAEKLYTSQGFVAVGERMFFNHEMRHLQKER